MKPDRRGAPGAPRQQRRATPRWVGWIAVLLMLALAAAFIAMPILLHGGPRPG